MLLTILPAPFYAEKLTYREVLEKYFLPCQGCKFIIQLASEEIFCAKYIAIQGFSRCLVFDTNQNLNNKKIIIYPIK